MSASDATPVPKKNAAFRLYFAIRKNDGTLITTWAGADSEVSLDGAAFADCTNEATEIGTTGCGYVDFTAAEMNADAVTYKLTVTNTSALPIVIVLFPEEAGDYRVAANQDVNVKTWNSLTTVALPLVPTTAGRTLDVSAGGEAGIDWANVGSPTTTIALSGTTIKTATDVETDTADIQSRLPAVLVSGRIDASVGAMAANTLTASALAADAVTEIQTGLATPTNITAATGIVLAATTHTGSIIPTVSAVTGLTVSNLDAAISSRASGVDLATVDTVVDTIKVKTDQLTFTVANQVDANALTGGGGGSAAAIADAVWDEVLSGHLTAGTTGKALSDAGGSSIASDVAAIKAKTDLITSQTANQTATPVNTLTIRRGDSFSGTHAVTTDYTGYTATFTIRHRVTDAVLVTASATVTNATTLTVTLTTTNTAFTLLVDSTEFGPHPYDIQLVNGATQATVSGVAIITRDQTRT